jgi:predicted dehydrogenase
MKALIVGMGFGKALYGNIYKNWEWDVTYVDLYDKTAHHKNISDVTGQFDIAHICTPTYTHYNIADAAAKLSKIVLVEKPGVACESHWDDLLNGNSGTRIMMTKNNQYRNNIEQMQQAAAQAKDIQLNWINNNRIPKPGSWFTSKHLSYGGVSRDLIPHMLSLYQLLNVNWQTTNRSSSQLEQKWSLNDIENSDYGKVDKKGFYNVDDFCTMQYIETDKSYTCTANWRSMTGDDIAVHCDETVFELGLCPEDAYERMIRTAIENKDNEEFWQQQKEMDLWIHRELETL